MYTRVRNGGRWVHPESFNSLGYALGVVRFIWGIWVHSGSPWGSLGSSAVVVFTRVHPGGRWVHPESLGR